jgi:uncharacterized protein (TIGR01777 family)
MDKMETILITGGTGMIGSALTKALTGMGYHVVILTRNAKDKKATPVLSYAEWDPEKQTIDEAAVKKADHIIHLAGANVAGKRWSEKRKQEIIGSRVKSGELIVKALKEIPNQVKTVISSSAIGYYGPDPQIPNPHPFTEESRPANDFLGTVVQQWEVAISPVTGIGKRLVIVRTGIVLSKEGGAYAEFVKPLKFGIASILGKGTQIVSWIYIEDLVRMYIDAIENKNRRGVYNAVAPVPVSNKDLILEIARQRNKIYVAGKVPEFVLKAMLGEMSIELLKSATVSAAKIEKEGFVFIFPSIQTAIRKLVAS